MSDNRFNFKDLRALEFVFVKNVLDGRRQYDGEIETICAVSPGAALMRLRHDIEQTTELLSLFTQAGDALHHLAYRLDVDGSIAAQIEEDGRLRGWAEERRAALDTLRRLAARGNVPLSREAAKERDAALKILVPMMPTKHEAVADMDDVPF